MINKQDYINSINQNIDMVRGDTLAFNFALHGLGEQSAYELLAVTMAIAEHYNSDPLIELNNEDGIALSSYDAVKDNAIFTVYLAPNKTKTLDLTRYYYDLQLKTDTDVLTLMRGRLSLLYDISE